MEDQIKDIIRDILEECMDDIKNEIREQVAQNLDITSVVESTLLNYDIDEMASEILDDIICPF